MENKEENDKGIEQIEVLQEGTDKLKAALELFKMAADFVEKNPKTTAGIVFGGLGFVVAKELFKKKQ